MTCSQLLIAPRRKNPFSMPAWQSSRGEQPSDRRIPHLLFQHILFRNRGSLTIHLVRKTHNLQPAPRIPPPHYSPSGNIARTPPVKLKLSCNDTINKPRCTCCVVTSVDLRYARQVSCTPLNLTCKHQVQFLLTLENISNRLLIIPKPARVSALRAELTALNHMLPAEVSRCLRNLKHYLTPVLGLDRKSVV